MGNVISINQYKIDKREREQAEEEQILDRQYEEFISLMSYFVSLQETEVESVTIDFGNEDIQLFDNNGNKMALDNGDDNIQDILISALMEYSPETIVIMNGNNSYTEQTIRKVFKDRVESL